jgi:glutathione synthase/RimK-type ligase-like ATP-grasp enzyme
MVKAIGVYREQKIARKPGSDNRILDLTAEELRKRGFQVELKNLREIKSGETVDIILNMARSEAANDILFEKSSEEIYVLVPAKTKAHSSVSESKGYVKLDDVDVILNMARGMDANTVLLKKESKGIYIVNPPESVILTSNKKELFPMLAKAGVSVPESKVYKTDELIINEIKQKSILKAANRHSLYFVVDVNDTDGLAEAIQKYKEAGVEEVLIEKFENGQMYKYYIVDDVFFLPDDVENKMPHELIKEIKKQILLIGETANLSIYGGDMIIDNDKVFFTDVNDWPSFSGTESVKQEDVASYIADFVVNDYKKFKEKI